MRCASVRAAYAFHRLRIAEYTHPDLISASLIAKNDAMRGHFWLLTMGSLGITRLTKDSGKGEPMQETPETKMAMIENAGRRRMLRAFTAGALATSGGLLSVRAFAGGLATVNMQLGWVPGGNQVGEVVARRLGYYEKEGIDF